VAASARQLITVFAVVAFAGGTGSAFADIDPASDVLPLQDVFLPYNPKVCTQLSTALRKLTARSRKAGYPVKVAVIASKRDLGGVSTLFGDPKAYARFLAQELVTYAPQVGTTYDNPPLLVAMPSGFGLDHGGAKAERVMEGLSISSFKPNDLARLIFIAPLAMLLLLGLVSASRRRLRPG